MKAAIGIASLATTLSIAGCIIPIAADGYFAVVGAVPASTACELVLSRASEPANTLQSQRVSGAFRGGFVVTPYSVDYRLAVVCHGVERSVTTVRYGAEVKPGQTVELGIIAL